jgi:hypothetical protein
MIVTGYTYGHDSSLTVTIKKALNHEGFVIKSENIDGKCLVGKRGLRANEWGAVAGVYYKIKDDRLLIYIRTKITQDVTGGVTNYIARRIGTDILALMKSSR